MIPSYLAVLLSVLSLSLSAFSFLFFRSYLKRRTSQEHILSEIRDEINSILKTIDKTTERDISLVEERERKLKSLLEEADERLKIYTGEVNKYHNAVDTYAMLMKRENNTANGNVSARENREPSSVVSQASAVVKKQGDSSYQDLGKNRYKLNTPGTVPPREPAPAAPVLTPASAFPLPGFTVKEEIIRPSVGTQIRELARAGIPPPAIASLLGISISEAEFAAALMERRDVDKR